MILVNFKRCEWKIWNIVPKKIQSKNASNLITDVESVIRLKEKFIENLKIIGYTSIHYKKEKPTKKTPTHSNK